ncbi:hypothetical protein [Aeromicrobium sp. Leaf291]|uniref:hypothetical protein n=1 Tax=Aeromicrobium sp. Leaf291 TaxID=1736325 RepID=UPI0006F749C1|nr:hypothetical protein [Aeromicrobium sp. Leaf291]KQP81559.1 hypothetical protein ASF35_16135 [Aeromicrobium sp. Leaf291]
MTSAAATAPAYVDPCPGMKGDDTVTEECGKCSGRGRIRAFAGYKFGICFDCDGDGVLVRKVRNIRAAARRSAKVAAAEADRLASHAARYDAARDALVAEAAELEAALSDGDDVARCHAAQDAVQAVLRGSSVADALAGYHWETEGRFAPVVVGANRYRGDCRDCGARVKAGAGVLVKADGEWLTYCTEHAPG